MGELASSAFPPSNVRLGWKAAISVGSDHGFAVQTGISLPIRHIRIDKGAAMLLFKRVGKPRRSVKKFDVAGGEPIQIFNGTQRVGSSNWGVI